VLQTV